MHQENTASKPRSFYLDFVRGLAVLGILFYHICPGTPMGFGQGSMELFFVISGFLITQTFSRRLQKGFSGIASFAGSRLRRLMPALVAYVTFAGIVNYSNGVSLNEIKNSAFFALAGFYNWYQIWSGNAIDGLGGIWSLAVEDQYYYSIAILGCFIILARKQGAPAPILFRFYIVCAGIALAMRVINTIIADLPLMFVSYNTFSRLWGFSCGGLAALCIHRINFQGKFTAVKARVYSQICFIIAVLVLLTVRSYEPRDFLLGWLLAPILFGGNLLLWSLATKNGTKGDLFSRIYRNRFFLWPKVRWLDLCAANLCVLVARIGVACYSIYLFQMSDQLLGFRFPWFVSLAWAVGAGFAVHILLERRFYRFPEYRLVRTRS